MIFAFFEEIDGPSWRARNPDPRGGDGLVFGRGPCARAQPGRELRRAAFPRQVSQLEEHFGVRLFHRTTRKLSLTDDGQMLLGLARPVLDGVEGIEAALGQQSALPVGLV